MTNSIRPVIVASLLGKGEAQNTLWSSGMRSAGRRNCAVGLGPKPDRCSGDDEGWLETEWMEDSIHETKRSERTGRRSLPVSVGTKNRRSGVRASIVALKRGNARGAKGRRE